MPWTGQPLRRLEDARLLTGHGQYVDDLPLSGAAEAAILRSPYAHARILSIDPEPARTLPGVLAVVTAGDLAGLNQPFPMTRSHPGCSACFNHPALAGDLVRYVGEPVAIVVAENRYVAEDALDLIAVEYEPLPAAVGVEAALTPGAPQVHAGAPGNLGGQYSQSTGDVESVLASAVHVFRHRLRIERGSAQPMETRAVAARFAEGQLTVWSSTQRPHQVRTVLAQLLGIPEDRVRAIAPDVGGAFGAKGTVYPEEFLVPYAAMRLNRPVRWVEDRRESFMATAQDRTQVFDVAAAVAEDGRLLGLKVEFLHDLGAYASFGFGVAQNAANHVVGPYKISAAAVSWKGVYTHCTPTGAYRGAGRPQGVYVIERTLDLVARQLGLDPAEIRHRNLIPARELPYDTGLGSGRGRVIYDSGDYPACQAAALAYLPYGHWRAEQARLRDSGRYLGLGLANYIEISRPIPSEGARVEITEKGQAVVYASTGSQGQGHRTSFSQIAADVLGLPPEAVLVQGGDTGLLDQGVGTSGSRSTIQVGSAIHLAAAEVRQQALRVAAQLLEVSESDLVFHGSVLTVRGVPARRLTLAEVAAATAARCTPLAATHYFCNDGAQVANGTHAVVIEIDPETGAVSFLRYVIVHDCGKVINPLIVDGQVVGGVAQALGGSLYERLVYDSSGQLLTATLADYLLPTASDMPPLELHHLTSPSPHNPLGVKGAGEGGAMAPYAVVAAAIEDATGQPVLELPLTPADIHRRLKGARGR